MKKIIIALACLAVTVSSYAQGLVNFNNYSVKAVIYNTDGKTLLSGSGYLAQLYAADGTVTSDTSLVAKGVALNFYDTTIAKYATMGGYVFPSGTTSLGKTATAATTVGAAAGTVTLQVRAWAGGTTASYEDAVAAGAATGKSALFTLTSTAAPTTPANLTGLTSFSLGVPEPTTIALGVMGAAALLFRRRK